MTVAAIALLLIGYVVGVFAALAVADVVLYVKGSR